MPYPHPPTQAPCTPALAHASSLDTYRTSNARATHALPLHPAALASVPYGEVLVRPPRPALLLCAMVKRVPPWHQFRNQLKEPPPGAHLHGTQRKKKLYLPKVTSNAAVRLGLAANPLITDVFPIAPQEVQTRPNRPTAVTSGTLKKPLGGVSWALFCDLGFPLVRP